ncbi:MAG TPA: SPFH domain-containing protein [Gemmatimonadaceae bacterium]|nr:SPFH domain-containing protein [Gemmatimonadaceae bacterium]
MSMRDFAAGEFIDIIEWIDESNDTLVWRFERPRNEIKNSAQLIVRPGQVAVFVEQGEIADVFVPGRHALTTMNLPVLSRLRGWKYGFESPFKADIVFVSTKQFVNRKWGTANPVIVRDPELGPTRVRAYGTYAMRVHDAAQLVREIVGTSSVFLVDEITDQLRDLVIAKVSESLASAQISVLELAAKYTEMSGRVLQQAAPQFQQYGLELTQLVIENVSLPEDVEQAIDQRARLNVIGGMDRYAALQSADALRDAARNPNGAAASGVGLGMGATMGQRAMAGAAAAAAAVPAAPSGDEPPPVPAAESPWYYAVGGERRGPVDLGSLRDLARAGTVTGEMLVWTRGMSQWATASGVPALAGLFSTGKGAPAN